MPDSTNLIAAGLITGYLVMLLVLSLRNRTRLSLGMRPWLVLTLLAALAALLSAVSPADASNQSATRWIFPGHLTSLRLTIVLTNGMLVLFAIQTLRYLRNKHAVALGNLVGLWWFAQAATSILVTTSAVGEPYWLDGLLTTPDAPAALAAGGWLAIGTGLIIIAMLDFYHAPLPEVANRALFWALIIPPVVIGAVMGVSGSDVVTESGWLIQFIGLAGAVYGVLTYRVIDVRRSLRQATATAIVTAITALVFFAALVIARAVDVSGSSRTIYVLLGGLSLAVAVAYIPIRQSAQAIVDSLFGRPPDDIPATLQHFSETISGVVDLDTLVDVALRTLQEMLNVRRGGLILVTQDTGEALTIEPVEPIAHSPHKLPALTAHLPANSPIYQHLVVRRMPLLQYDLDFGRTFADARPDERSFFQQMRLSAYAPVLVQGKLIGLLGAGAKTTDDSFTPRDLSLLLTIANQLGIALRNARLVTDLRTREAEQAALNRALSRTTEKLERLDSVKTDFVTIASHELRTPLAQIRGYTDILAMINEDGMLDPDEVAGMTYSLRRASDRLEDLIAAMLDVSELDVDAMDLHFTEISLENVIRTAIESLAESIKQRKLRLSARGLRGLPPIQGDLQRLVQAFRNVIVNSVKYTPDGGQIEITAHQHDQEIHVIVRDYGVGIDPANLPLIFEKFFRAQDTSLHSTGATKFMGAGPGLGLTIARGVFEGHGGRIRVESEGYDPENLPGSTFTIVLPLVPPETAQRILPFRLKDLQLPGAVGSDARDAFLALRARDASPTLPHRPDSLKPPDSAAPDRAKP